MRIPNSVHEADSWRIHEIVPDFMLEDVWLLPARGGAEDFQAAYEMLASFDPTNADSLAARVLWDLRDRIGGLLGLGRISVEGNVAPRNLPIPGTIETSLMDRLPADLQNTTAGLDLGAVPFQPLYRTDNEFAAEISNRTVHGVLHLAWVADDESLYHGQMAVYVKPRGRLGKMYMDVIKPFRYRIIYPALMRQIERAWQARAAADDPSRRH